MKNYILSAALFFFCISLLNAQQTVPFKDFFEDATMRIDYHHIADSKSEFFTLDKVYKQNIWAGSKKNLIDRFNNGRYYAKIYDQATDKLLFSHGFDSYCGEYRTSSPAINGIKKTFHETVLVPFPKNKIKFTLENRDRENNLHQIFSQDIDPNSFDIIKDNLSGDVLVIESHKSGKPDTKVDLAIIGEGYTENEQKKFQNDLKKFTKIFFTQEPYNTYQDRFNVYGVLKFSYESGTDEPRANIFKNTAINTTFNSMGSERYLLTEDNKALHDIAAYAPYDAILIMVNHPRYGGGGIYNFFLTFTSDNQWHEYLLLHEFGHSFTGLADEYYTSSVSYNEFYPRGIEPVEPNITALLNPENLKWKNLITPGIAIPTPWEKEEFDSMSIGFQEIREKINDKIAHLKREKASEEEIKKAEDEANTLSIEHAKILDEYLHKSKFVDKVGAFEGAGYSSEGLYRSMLDCIMFTKGKKPYCKVCESRIIDVIKFYSE
jgi:hypothetical protein